jgi:hypothetical protein
MGLGSAAVGAGAGVLRKRPRLSVGAINHAFLSAGGNAGEYGAAMHRAVAVGWLEAHPSGAYVVRVAK